MSTGSADGGRPRVARTHDLEKRILEHFAGEPGIKRRKSAAAFPDCHMPDWKGLREQPLFSFNLRCKRV
jgi:hypothetical protein